MRLILNQIGRRLTESLDGSDGIARRHKMLLMLDEFPALGWLDFFESALAFMAGYGLRAFLIAQSLNQINKSYGQNHSILDNCHVRVAFATNDERTAKRISEALGTATEQRAQRNYPFLTSEESLNAQSRGISPTPSPAGRLAAMGGHRRPGRRSQQGRLLPAHGALQRARSGERNAGHWRAVAASTSTDVLEVEIVCSDRTEHRRRVEGRKADIQDFTPPTWEAVLHHEYEAWTTSRLVIDSALFTASEAAKQIRERLSQAGGR